VIFKGNKLAVRASDAFAENILVTALGLFAAIEDKILSFHARLLNEAPKRRHCCFGFFSLKLLHVKITSLCTLKPPQGFCP
jgi:hypothetical protein